MQQTEIEPELMQPVPRRVILLRTSSMGCGFTLFFLPFILAGTVLLSYVLYKTAVIHLGRTVEGRVVKKEVVEDSDSTSYCITYTFDVNHAKYKATDDVPETIYPRIKEGASVTVKYLEFSPQWGSYLPAESAKSDSEFLWLFTLLWNGFLTLLASLLLWAWVRSRKLVRFGTAVRGTVTGKSQQSDSDSTRYLLDYTFVIEETLFKASETVNGQCNLSQSEWESLNIGMPVTVLYLPKDVTHNDLYLSCIYRASAKRLSQ